MPDVPPFHGHSQNATVFAAAHHAGNNKESIYLYIPAPAVKNICMNNTSDLDSFHPMPPDAAGVLSWAHVGDLHMRSADEQNTVDLRAIVDEVNAVFAGSISFVFLPGDNADHGDASAYTIIRDCLNRLEVPWCAIVGDHDVEQKSLQNFRTFLSEQPYYSFRVGNARFLALNAFDVPDPPSFTILAEQRQWLEEQLKAAAAADQLKILLLHCYPSDLKQGREELVRLIAQYEVKLIDMGHTHYNEISHDGKTIYTATRSTGQIEEGPVGFSITNLDNGIVSWRFLQLQELPAVVITAPADERLTSDVSSGTASNTLRIRVRAKIWAQAAIRKVEARIAEQTAWMQLIPGSNVWEATLSREGLSQPVHPLRVIATDANGKIAMDEIRALVGPGHSSRRRAERDQDNALEAWPEHGLLATRLGPNKNGKKW